MPISVMTDQGLHSLSMSHKKDARLIWVKTFFTLCRQNVKNSILNDQLYLDILKVNWKS